MLENVFQALAIHSHFAAQRIETHGSKIIKVLIHHRDGQVDIIAGIFAAQLQQYALLQVTSSDTRRVQRLYDLKHFLDLFCIHDIAVVESHIICYLTDRASQISVILQVADDGVCNDLLCLIQFQFTQLVGQKFLQGLLAHGNRSIVLIVTAAIVGKITVPGRRIVVSVAVHLAAGRGPGIVAVTVTAVVVVGAVIVIIVRLLLQCLNFIDLVVDEFGHLGIILFQHQSQHPLLFQCQTLRLLLFDRESLFCHRL